MRILILSASVGSGHMRAAQAVEAALREVEPAATIRIVDVLDLADRSFRAIYDRGYMGLAFSAPHLWGYLYDAMDKPAAHDSIPETLRRFIEYWSLRSLPALLREEPWDAVVHTHFLPAELAALLRARRATDVPQLTVVTDFEAHRLWVHDASGRYCVATPEAAACVRSWGVPEDRIEVSGIPIHPVFSRPVDRERCRREHDLRGDRPIILQLAGGEGKGPVESILKGITEMGVPTDILVVAGRNAELRQRLSAAPVPSRHRVRVLGFTDRIHELMAAADLLVTKPGGLTAAEALACGLPMVLVNPIPGQETRNSDHLLETGAAVKVNALAALTRKMEGLLMDPQRLEAMQAAARRAGRPGAAYAVARVASELARNPTGSAVYIGSGTASVSMRPHA